MLLLVYQQDVARDDVVDIVAVISSLDRSCFAPDIIASRHMSLHRSHHPPYVCRRLGRSADKRDAKQCRIPPQPTAAVVAWALAAGQRQGISRHP